MFSSAPMVGLAVLFTCCLTFTADAANACDGPREVREATRASLKEFIRARQMTVLTFTGYSGAQRRARRTLEVRGLCVFCQRQYLGRAGSRNRSSLADLCSDRGKRHGIRRHWWRRRHQR